MGGARMGERRHTYRVLVGTAVGKNHFEDVRLNCMGIFNWVLK